MLKSTPNLSGRTFRRSSGPSAFAAATAAAACLLLLVSASEIVGPEPLEESHVSNVQQLVARTHSIYENLYEVRFKMPKFNRYRTKTDNKCSLPLKIFRNVSR